LGWAVKLKKNTPFLGRDALVTQAAAPLRKRLACFTVDDPKTILLGRETIFRDGKQVGWLTSGGWGYSVQKNIGYGYVRNSEGVSSAYLTRGHYELEVATDRVPATLHLGPLVDPKMEKIKV
jgi:4-methylaminobutanoate oxidase (formaldehyde-forming)